MVLSREQKGQQIQEFKTKIEKANSIIVWDYFGNDANFISKVKQTVVENNGEDVVYKNRLAKLAFKESDKLEIVEYLTGPSSFIFIYDEENRPLKELNKLLKENKKKDFLKAGYVDGQFYDQYGIKEMAELPSRNELVSMLLSVMQGDVRKLAYALTLIKNEE